jgi:ATP-dependent Clp endopeptidase proteolytic subunit ClpP
MSSWYTIEAKKVNDEPIVDLAIYDEIGFWGVTAKDFITELEAKKGAAKKARLMLNSPGGSVFDGFAIFNALKHSGLEIDVTVMGIAASMASVIAMVGKTISMPVNSMMMIHNASAGVFGNAAELADVIEVLKKMDASITATYMARTGKSEADVKKLMSAETYMTAAEALNLGFATKVTDEAKVTACFALDNLPDKVRQMFKASAAKPAEPTPEGVKTVTAFAEEVSAIAKAAGVEEYAPFIAMNCATVDEAKTAINSAKEIKAFCTLAKMPDKASAYIRSGKAVADVKADIKAALAKADEDTDTSQQTNLQAQAAGKQQRSSGGGWANVDLRKIYDNFNGNRSATKT